MTGTISLLVVALRAHGLALAADMILAASASTDLMNALREAASGARQESWDARWIIRKGDDRVAVLDRALRLDLLAIAADWLGSAIRAIYGRNEPDEGARMVEVAESLIAQAEARPAT